VVGGPRDESIEKPHQIQTQRRNEICATQCNVAVQMQQRDDLPLVVIDLTS
jgi:hypothetical protein